MCVPKTVFFHPMCHREAKRLRNPCSYKGILKNPNYYSMKIKMSCCFEPLHFVFKEIRGLCW